MDLIQIPTSTTKEELGHFLSMNRFNRLTLVEKGYLDKFEKSAERKLYKGKLDIVNETYAAGKKNNTNLHHVLYELKDGSEWLFTPPATIEFKQVTQFRDDTLRRGSAYCLPDNVTKAYLINVCSTTVFNYDTNEPETTHNVIIRELKK